MKKIISTILVLSMLISACVLLASCGGVKEKDFEKQPAKTLTETLNNTYSAFFADGAGLYEATSSTAKKSSVDVYFESELLGEDISRIFTTVYSDVSNNKSVIELGAIYKDDPIGATVYSDKNGIIFSGEAIFDSKDSYGFFYDTFINEFANSDLAEMNDLDADDTKQIIDFVIRLQETMNKSVKDNIKESYELANEFVEIFGQEITAEEVEINGEDVDCFVVTYNIDNKSLELALNKCYDEYIKDQDTDDITKEDLEELIDEINKDVKIDMTVEATVIKKTNTFSSIKIEGEFSEKQDKDDVDDMEEPVEAVLECIVNFSDTEIEATCVLEVNEEKIAADLLISKEINKSNVIYNVEVRMGTKSVYLDLIDGDIIFNDDGSFEVIAEIMKDEHSTYDVKIDGTYEIEKDNASIELTSLKVDKTTFEFKLGIIYNTDPEIPETPEDAEDLIDFSESDWEELGEAIDNSDFAKMLEEIFGDEEDSFE